MTDLERRLTDALTNAAQEAPAAVGLADAARARARTRRRTRLVGAAAAVAFCVGVPAGVVAVTHGSDPDRPGPSHAATDGTDSRVPDGMRVESWHGVTALVPESWGYGSLEGWCAGGGQLEPRVERPGGVSLDIKCATSTYGLSFQKLPPGQDRDEVFDWPVALQTSAGWPPDAYVGAHGIGDVLVEVTAPTAEQAQAILGTVHPIESVDLNGCATEGYTSSRRPSAGAVSVCRYDADGLLEQSELLTGAQADHAIQAVDASSEPVTCGNRLHGPALVRLRWSSDSAFVYVDDCQALTHGDRPSATYALTPDVLYWALSPGWSGQLPAGVPLPQELRQR